MTVSKALRGQGRISKAMCERVRAEAVRLGYHPNPHGVGLAKARQGGGCQGTLALLVGHRDANPLTANPQHPLHYHYPWMVAGARARAEELGYGLDVFWVFEPGLSAGRLDAILAARAINGVILLSVQPGEIAIDWSRYACACLGRPEKQEGPFAFTDFFAATRLAFFKTHAAGYRRIGLVIDGTHDRLSEGRCVGACVAAQPACTGAEWVRPLVAPAATLDSAVLERWLDSEHPDAILYFRNRVPELITELNTHAPRSIGLVDLDLRMRDGSSAGIWLPHDRIGAAGVDLVNGQLQRGERGLEADSAAMGLPGRWQGGVTLPEKE